MSSHPIEASYTRPTLDLEQVRFEASKTGEDHSECTSIPSCSDSEPLEEDPIVPHKDNRDRDVGSILDGAEPYMLVRDLNAYEAYCEQHCNAPIPSMCAQQGSMDKDASPLHTIYVELYGGNPCPLLSYLLPPERLSVSTSTPSADSVTKSRNVPTILEFHRCYRDPRASLIGQVTQGALGSSTVVVAGERTDSAWQLFLVLCFPYMGPEAHENVFCVHVAPIDGTCTPTPPQTFPFLRYRDRVALRLDPGKMDRYQCSYLIFLSFFGWQMYCQRNGMLDRYGEGDEDPRSWKVRYRFLTRNPHYWDAWTRVLRSLLDTLHHIYARYAVKFMIEELEKGRLQGCGLETRLERYWIRMLRDVDDRKRFTRRVQALYRSDSDE